MSIESEIKDLASTVPIGYSAYFDCPKCGRKKKFGITNNGHNLKYQCFSLSCRLRNPPGGMQLPLSKEILADILNRKPVEHTKEGFKLPTYWLEGFASEESIALAVKYDLLEAYSNKYFRTLYDPRLNRQVFLYTDIQGNVVGAMGRALGRNMSKAYIYPNSLKTPFVVGKGTTAIIVEDVLSAIRLSNIGYTGIALSGTSIELQYFEKLKGYASIIVCLDKDASIKSLELKKAIDFYCKDVSIKLIEKDFKDLTRQEALNVLG